MQSKFTYTRFSSFIFGFIITIFRYYKIALLYLIMIKNILNLLKIVTNTSQIRYSLSFNNYNKTFTSDKVTRFHNRFRID